MINQDPMDILHDDYCQSLSEAESLPSSESDFDGCNHRCWQRSGFDTMALIIMLHHYLVGTFGLLNLLNLMCWWQFDCWYQFVFGLLIWLWLWLIDYNLMMTWWLDSMITIWLQWFDYNSVTMIWGWQWYLQTWYLMTWFNDYNLVTMIWLQFSYNDLRMTMIFTNMMDILWICWWTTCWCQGSTL